MKELFKHYKNYIFALALPYIILMFLLVVPIEFSLQSPGGLTEVEDLIEIDYIENQVIEGSISTTYIVSISRPTYFQFILGTFSDYSSISVLSSTYSTYTNAEIAKISQLSKEIAMNTAIIVAYEEAKITDPDIVIDYEQTTVVYGKSEYLDYYSDIEIGDEFVQIIGDNDYVVTDYSEISDYTELSDSYDWTFMNADDETYTLTLTKDEETDLFGITLRTYYGVDSQSAYPVFTEANSNIGGPSGGLLQTLSIYNMLVEEDLTKGLKIAGTGTISIDGSTGYIGGVEQKIITAYLNNVDLYFIPSLDEDYYYDNYQEALRVCEEYNIDPTGWLIPVSSFSDVLEYLEGLE